MSALSPFRPTGLRVASASSDKTVRLWNAQTAAPLRVFTGHTDTVRPLAYHPSGTLIVSASDDRTIRGWDPQTAAELFSLPSPKNSSAITFSPDGKLLASGDDWGNVTIWDVATWSPRTSVKGSDTPRLVTGVFSRRPLPRRRLRRRQGPPLGPPSPARSPSSSTATKTASMPSYSLPMAAPSPPPVMPDPSNSGARKSETGRFFYAIRQQALPRSKVSEKFSSRFVTFSRGSQK